MLGKIYFTENKNLEKRKFNSKSNIIFLIFFVLFSVTLTITVLLTIFGSLKWKFYGDVLTYAFLPIFFLTIGIAGLVASAYDNKLSTKALGILFVILTIIPTMFLPNYIKDLRKLNNSEYSYYEGELTSYYIEYGKVTKTKFSIKDKRFTMKCKPSRNSPLIIGEKYRVEFLPNTKFVVNLYKETT